MESMETIGILLCLSAVCILLAVMIRGMLSRRSRRRSLVTETERKEPETQLPEEIKPEKYTSVYEFVRIRGFTRCPECDGENDIDAFSCCICGSRLKN